MRFPYHAGRHCPKYRFGSKLNIAAAFAILAGIAGGEKCAFFEIIIFLTFSETSGFARRREKAIGGIGAGANAAPCRLRKKSPGNLPGLFAIAAS